MKVVTCPEVCRYGGGEEVIPAGERLVIPDWAAQSIALACRDDGSHPRITDARHYTRPYFGQDLDGKRLIARRGLGIGDQLVFAGVLAILKRLYPQASIDTYSYPGVHEALWEGADDLPFRALPEPILFDEDWQKADYHLIADGWCECDKEPDQPSMWDGHLQCSGLDPDEIPAEWRVPVVPVTVEDFNSAFDARPHGLAVLWQVAASTPVRTYRPNLTLRAMELLRAEYSDVEIIATGSPKQLDAMELPAGMRTTEGLSLRAVMALAGMVDAVVCPDSYLGHVTAAHGTPTVSLWSSFLPADRVGSYTCHRPLVGEIECSPCRHHEKTKTCQGCPKTWEDEHASRYCEGLARIAPEEIVEAVKEIVR